MVDDEMSHRSANRNFIYKTPEINSMIDRAHSFGIERQRQRKNFYVKHLQNRGEINSQSETLKCLSTNAVISDPDSRCPHSHEIVLKFNFISESWRPRYQYSFAIAKTIFCKHAENNHPSQALSSSWPRSRPVKSKLFWAQKHIVADRTSQLFLAPSENRRPLVSPAPKHVRREKFWMHLDFEPTKASAAQNTHFLCTLAIFSQVTMLENILRSSTSITSRCTHFGNLPSTRKLR